MTRTPQHEIGILAEDLQGALTAASRLQQRGVTVEVVRDRTRTIGDAQALVVDLDAARSRDPYARAREWTTWLKERGCSRIELRTDTLLRGTPVDCLAGMTDGSGLENPLIAVMPGYPSAGRVCIDGIMHVPSATDGEISFSVADGLLSGADAEVISVDTLTQGAGAVDARISEILQRGVRRIVFDSTTEGHLAVAGASIARLESLVPVLTVTSGAWLRYHPALDSDGFVVVIASGANDLDTVQLARIADVYGPLVHTTTGHELLGLPDRQLQQLVARHRLFVLHAAGDTTDPAAVAALLASAARRLLDTSTTTRNPGLGVICSGGVTTGAVIRALDPDDLRPGNELEPLCPVVRLAGGPFPNLAVISKASGIGSAETLVRLVRRVIGT